MDDAFHTHPLELLIRIGMIATCPLLAVSIFASIVLSVGLPFVADFTVENKTDATISVTPVGTVGKQGDRHPLPVCMWLLPPVPSPQCGGFDIPPGESVEIMYDMDDISFSEIVVHDQDGERGQLVVDPNPTHGQYHSPSQTHFTINDLDALEPVPDSVRNAAHHAQIPSNAARIILCIVVVPWIILGALVAPWLSPILLSRLSRSCGKAHATRKPVAGGT